MIPELKAKIQATNAKALVMDSLISIAGGTISPKDTEFALLLYRLNNLASEMGVAILLIHHLTKDSNRQEFTKEAIYDSAFIFAATADCWGYWRAHEEGKPQFKLRVLKARSNTVELGTIYVFNGNEEDHRLTFKGFGDRVVSLDELKTKRDKVMALLHRDGSQKWSGADISEFFGWGGSRYAENVLAKLYEQRCGVDRVPMPSTGGRRKYAYFSVLGGEVKKSDFPTASTPPKTGSEASGERDWQGAFTHFLLLVILNDLLLAMQWVIQLKPGATAGLLHILSHICAPTGVPEHQDLVLACRTPQPVRRALMASLSSFRANRMSYSNLSAPTLAENCLSCSALRLMR